MTAKKNTRKILEGIGFQFRAEAFDLLFDIILAMDMKLNRQDSSKLSNGAKSFYRTTMSWANSLYNSMALVKIDDDMALTQERASLLGILKDAHHVMEMQLDRELGSIHIPPQTAISVYTEVKNNALSFLKKMEDDL